MQRPIKDLAKKALYGLGYYHAYRRIKASKEPRLLILMYHDILTETRANDPLELDDDSPAPREFEAHLRLVTRHYRPVSLRESVERLRSGTLEQNSVAITFDDGYSSFYTVAYPILREFDTPATMFLLTDWIDQQEPFWWHIVRDMVRRSPRAEISRAQLEAALEIPCHGFREGPFDTRSRRGLVRVVEGRFRNTEDQDRLGRLQRLERFLFPDADYRPKREEPLTWDQIREMAAHRIEFEAHTCSHVNIRHANPATIEQEILTSKLRIEKEVGIGVAGFAYPYGKDIAHYAAVRSTLEKHGFRYACTTQSNLNSHQTDPYLLSREALPPTTSRATLHRALILRFAAARES